MIRITRESSVVRSEEKNYKFKDEFSLPEADEKYLVESGQAEYVKSAPPADDALAKVAKMNKANLIKFAEKHKIEVDPNSEVETLRQVISKAIAEDEDA